MTDYTPEQTQRLRRAIAEGREAMRRAGQFQPLVFAQAFLVAGGLQIPGAADNEETQRLADQLLQIIAQGGSSNHPVLRRELERARNEARWTQAAEADDVIGFRLELAPAALLDRSCRQVLKADHGLGSAVFRKAEIVVLPAACEGARFFPVYAHEIEQ